MAFKHTLAIDLETYSSVNLAEAGVHKYVESDDFEVMLFGYKLDDAPVVTVDVADGERIPEDILSMLTDPDVLKTAYNAPFERNALRAWLGVDMEPAQWQCTMVLAASVGLPLGLKAVCDAMGLPPDQAKKDGDALIRYFAGPCKPTITNGGRTRNMPWDDYDKWSRYKSYNTRDVEVESLIRHKLIKYIPSDEEQKFWQLDQNINDKGVRLDLQLAHNAIKFNEIYSEELTDRAVAISGISNIKSNMQIKAWLNEVEDAEFDSLNKKAMPDVLANIKTDKAKELLELRKELSKTSTAKFDKMITCACKDEHARGLFQFYGATRTGRFAGRLLQLQNLPQNHLDDLADTRALVRAGEYEELRTLHPNVSSTLSELIRTAIIPEPGCHFIVCDFSAIEARVIAFISGEQWRLDVFRNGGDIYCESASHIFGVPVEKNGINGHLRQRGKCAELGLGYGGSVGALRTMDINRALIDEPDESLKKLVQGWREASPHIVSWWSSLENAFKECIRTKSMAMDDVGGILFDYNHKNVFMVLPSGRRICYINPRIGLNRFGNESIVYQGQNQVTRKWELLESYGGKLSENVVQATSRDILRDSMMRLNEAGYDLRMHVHDEVIINEPNDSGRTLEDVIKVMTVVPDWAEGLPLNAAGFTADFYMKD